MFQTKRYHTPKSSNHKRRSMKINQSDETKKEEARSRLVDIYRHVEGLGWPLQVSLLYSSTGTTASNSLVVPLYEQYWPYSSTCMVVASGITPHTAKRFHRHHNGQPALRVQPALWRDHSCSNCLVPAYR